MVTAAGKYICDAEIGRPGKWRGCRRLACVAIQARDCELHYCQVHRGHAHGRDGLYFRRKPGEVPRALTDT